MGISPNPNTTLSVPKDVEAKIDRPASIYDPNLVDSDASFHAKVADAPFCVHPSPASKLRRGPIVEASYFEVMGQMSGSNKSNNDSDIDTSNCPNSHRRVTSNDSSACTSSVVKVRNDDTPSNYEAEATPIPAPPRKSFCPTTLRAGQTSIQPTMFAAIDVDVASNLAPLPPLFSKGDFNPMDTEVSLKQEKIHELTESITLTWDEHYGPTP